MSSSVRTVSLNDVVVGSKPTHIIIYQESSDPLVNIPSESRPSPNPLEADVKELRERIAQLEKFIESLDADSIVQTKLSPFFHAQISGPIGLEVRRLEEAVAAPLPVATVFETLVRSVRATPALVPELPAATPAPIDIDEKFVAQPILQDVEVNQEEVEEDQEEEVEEDQEEDQEEEAMELTEFEYKGSTYYRDAENQVYQKDEDGDLDDDPIGVWNEAKQKVLKYPKK